MRPITRIRTRYSLFLLMLLALAALAMHGARRSQAQEGPPPQTPAGVPHGRAQVSASSLNLRTGPHVSYTAVAYLMEGEEVEIIGRNRTSTWVQIRLYNGYHGWINASYIRATIAIEALPVVDVALLGTTAFVTNDPVPVYSGPGAGYQLIDRARPGDVLTLNGRDAAAAWVHVHLPDGRAGWAAADSSFLPTGTINDLPIIAPFLDAPPPDLSPFFMAYAGPGFLYDPVDSVAEGDSLAIISRTADNRWIQVRLPSGREGWIAAEIVHIDAALAGVPVVSGIAPPQVVGWMPSRPAQSPPSDGTSSDGPSSDAPSPTAEPTEEPSPAPTDDPSSDGATPTAGVPTATPTSGRQPPSQATSTPTATAEAQATAEPTATATVTPEPQPTAEPTGQAGAATPPPNIPFVYGYAEPYDDATPIFRVLPGQSVVLIGRTVDSEWIKIWLSDEQEGWVRADAVELDIDLSVLPVVDP